MKDGKLDADALLQVMEDGFKSAGVTMDEETIRNVISDCDTKNSKHLCRKRDSISKRNLMVRKRCKYYTLCITGDTGKCTRGYNSWNCVTARLLDYGVCTVTF
jgi:hypothetical protein